MQHDIRHQQKALCHSNLCRTLPQSCERFHHKRVPVLQAEAMEQLQNSDKLTAEETDIVRWAINAKWRKPKRFVDDRAPLLTYKKASALEALVCTPPLPCMYKSLKLECCAVIVRACRQCK
jgi:23S rRNA maturation mini-RNase III